MRFSRKTLSLLLVFVMIIGMITGCAQTDPEQTSESLAEQAEEKKVLFKPGTYMATAEGGYGGPISVSVTVSETEIEEIKVTEHKETESIGGIAISQIPEAIVKTQSLDVDAVSGATLASRTLLTAIKDALMQSGADIDKLMAAQQKEETISNTDTVRVETDVVIVGAGAAGFAAAVKINELGGSTVILEKMPYVGGNTVRAGGAMNAADPERQNKQNMSKSEYDAILELLEIEPKNDTMKRWQDSVRADLATYNNEKSDYLYDSVDLHKLQSYVDGDYVGNVELIEYLCDHALESIHWLEGKGVEFEDEIGMVVGAIWRRSHMLVRAREMGVAIIEPLQQVAMDGETELYLQTKATELIENNGRVTGVKAVGNDGTNYEFIGAKGVIMATGGFGANIEMRQEYNTSGKWATLGEEIPTTNHPGATGDGIVMGQAIGADIIDMDQIQLMPMWPKTSGEGGHMTGVITNLMFVNENGERFVKEDGRRDEISIAALEQPGGYYWIVNDYADATDNGLKDDYLAAGVASGRCVMGNTIEELAVAMGTDPDSLKKTVEEFNNYVDGEKDPLGRSVFGKRIETGPFYASTFSPAVHHTMGGLRVNTFAQVLNNAGTPIEGLYAAGEVTGGLHGANRIGGNAVPDAIVNGMNAGENIMK